MVSILWKAKLSAQNVKKVKYALTKYLSLNLVSLALLWKLMDLIKHRVTFVSKVTNAQTQAI